MLGGLEGYEATGDRSGVTIIPWLGRTTLCGPSREAWRPGGLGHAVNPHSYPRWGQDDADLYKMFKLKNRELAMDFDGMLERCSN